MIRKLIICWLAIPPLAFSQELPSSVLEPAKVAEELFAQQELDLNYEELYESILQYLATPLDINKASAEQLRSLFILNDRQINDFIVHRNINGALLSIYELQSIESFDADLIRRLTPFISVTSAPSASRLLRRIISEPNNYFLLRYERTFEERAGFQDSEDSVHRFLGTPDKYFARFRVSHPGDFSLGLTIEKDPGERKISDYYSFHFQKSGGRKVVNFIVGDFQAFFGQGLIMGGGFGMGKGSETILTMRKNTLGFIPWTSSGETGFFRGIGSSIAITRKLFVHSFASVRSLDGTVRGDSFSAEQSFTPQTTGLHRNQIEIERRKSVSEKDAGAVVEYRNHSLQLGASLMSTQWNLPLTRSGDVYDRLEPSGASCTNIGAFANYAVRNFNLFGEMAHTIGWGTGVIAGTLISVNKKTDFAIVARRYEQDFWSPYGSVVSENTTAQNESAVYWGWKVQVSRKLTLAGYADVFHFPWLQYRAYTTSFTGHDALLRVSWKPQKNLSLVVQAREERKARNTGPDLPLYLTSVGIKRNFCFSLDYNPGPVLLRTRIQGSTFRLDGRSGGMAVLQDIGIEYPRWSIFLRHALFDTDNFDNRQYTYEPDVLMAYSFPAYYGAGARSAAMLRVNLGRHLDLWFRWARTRLEDRSSTGSGVDLLEGPLRNDLKFQLRLKL